MAGRVPFHERVWDVVSRIPRGKVLSYGDVARLAGSPRAARIVASALKYSKRTPLPWQRVVGESGEVRIQDPGLRAEQIRRLRAEGVLVDEAGAFDLARYRWHPSPRRNPPAPARRTSRDAPASRRN